jgi:hypothetical protein
MVNMDFPPIYFCSFLKNAIFMLNPEMVKFLIDKGANVNQIKTSFLEVKDDITWYSPLYFAIARIGKDINNCPPLKAIIITLLKNGARPDMECSDLHSVSVTSPLLFCRELLSGEEPIADEIKEILKLIQDWNPNAKISFELEEAYETTKEIRRVLGSS